MNRIAAVILGLALVHTFCAKYFDRLAERGTRHAGLFHLLGEVEVVFGFWAFVLVAAMGLTAVTDNAALTYLGSLIRGISPTSQYMLMAGAVAGGGLTVIANAPNPAGAALLKNGFDGQAIGALGLLLGALPPIVVAAALFLA